MKTRKQIRHTYTKYLVIYLNMVDALKFEEADRWYLKAETLATDVLNRDIYHDANRLITARARQQLQALYKKVFK